MDGDESVQLPLWGIILISIVGPTLVYVYEKILKPWWELRHEKEETLIEREHAEAERLRIALEQALQEHKESWNLQIQEMKNEMAETERKLDSVTALHQQCKDDTYNQGILLAQTAGKLNLLEDRLRAAGERINVLSNENAELRRILVAQEKMA